MKKIKRLSIELLHREVTISIGGRIVYFQDGESGAMSQPAFCPTCGSPWITAIMCAVGDVSASAQHIDRVLRQSCLHVLVSPEGQLRICQKSFEELKEKF